MDPLSPSSPTEAPQRWSCLPHARLAILAASAASVLAATAARGTPELALSRTTPTTSTVEAVA